MSMWQSLSAQFWNSLHTLASGGILPSAQVGGAPTDAPGSFLDGQFEADFVPVSLAVGALFIALAVYLIRRLTSQDG